MKIKKAEYRALLAKIGQLEEMANATVELAINDAPLYRGTLWSVYVSSKWTEPEHISLQSPLTESSATEQINILKLSIGGREYINVIGVK